MASDALRCFRNSTAAITPFETLTGSKCAITIPSLMNQVHLCQHLSRLSDLDMEWNAIRSFTDVENLTELRKLSTLKLLGNPLFADVFVYGNSVLCNNSSSQVDDQQSMNVRCRMREQTHLSLRPLQLSAFTLITLSCFGAIRRCIRRWVWGFQDEDSLDPQCIATMDIVASVGFE